MTPQDLLDKTIRTEFDVPDDYLTDDQLKKFDNLLSQTSRRERVALYATAKYFYTGEGEIYDIGTAAGGSTYCLAAGVRDSQVQFDQPRVHGFDLYGGYSIEVFESRLKDRGLEFESDLDFFDWQTKDVADELERTKVDLITDSGVLKNHEKIEVAHIDAAKSMRLWPGIFAAIANRVIPGKTIWIFQDFARIRANWHVYGLNELLQHGRIIGGAWLGVIYFQFDEAISQETITKIYNDDFTVSEKVAAVENIYDIIEDQCPHLFTGKWVLDDYRIGTQAYCHFYDGDKQIAREMYATLTPQFRDAPLSAIYKTELG